MKTCDISIFTGIQMFTLLLSIPRRIKKFSWWRVDIEKFLAAGIDRMQQDLSAVIFGNFYQEKVQIRTPDYYFQE